MKISLSLMKSAMYALTCISLFILAQSSSSAQTAPNLGTAKAYGAFSGAGAIESTGLTVVVGNIGTHVGAFTGFPPGVYTGEKHVADAATLKAKDDLTTAYNSMNDATNAAIYDTVLGATMGNGQVLTPRTYSRGDLTTVSGNLTFDAQGNPDAVFIIKIGAALNVSKFTKMLLAGGAKATNIYWAVGGAVSVLDSSVFKGTILSDGAIHFYGGSTLEGSALAMAGAVTLAGNTVSGPLGFGPPDSLIVVTPAMRDSLRVGQQNYQITWRGTGVAVKKVFEYSIDSGATWRMIDTLSTIGFSRSWTVPDAPSTKALVRITDANGLRGVSGLFTIAPIPNIKVINPIAGAQIFGGTQNYQITWSGSGIADLKTFEYSLDSGATWTLIGGVSDTARSYSWNVPDTVSNKAMVRITDANNLRGVSKVFSIVSNSVVGSITIVRPSRGEALIGGTQDYFITWTGSGIAPMKTIALSLDSGLTWTTISEIVTDAFIYAWDVPDTNASRALVRITDSKGVTATSGLFRITSSVPLPGSITIFHPLAGEQIMGGYVDYPVVFTAINTTSRKTFEYSLDGGATWVFIATENVDGQIYAWALVPNVTTTQALLRITDSLGVTGTSEMFSIVATAATGSIDRLTLSGFDSGSNIDNNRVLTIDWTYTPEIGTSVNVEYSLDYTATWNHIATVQTVDIQRTTWITPMGGFYNPVFIRVTSSLGMTRASQPFSIGTVTSVASEASALGYSVSNSPNPASSQTVFHVVLPTASNVTLSIIDQRGINVGTVVDNHFNAGTYDIPFTTSMLASGVYTYVLSANGVRVAGRLVTTK
ncbi:MAG: DUF3494 domain-containing protein [Candidatus Kapabacteria bacterium]|nr:DUF3494 domain-containing protein [Candidatus Kapabacteria bacterium]